MSRSNYYPTAKAHGYSPMVKSKMVPKPSREAELKVVELFRRSTSDPKQLKADLEMIGLDHLLNS